MSVFSQRSVLITGGAGSFGRAFAARALAAGAARVAIFSRSESRQAEMRAAMPDPRLRFLLGDVRDPVRVMDACRDVDLVVHAAALKRVERCESDPGEAIATNVLGSEHVARACIERGVAKAVFLSTDKAAAANTLYGSTKHTAERAWCQWNVYAAGTETRFAATRYGNVLGSTGSVVPVWRAQASGGVVDITDPAMTRFWMTMAQAVDLVVTALESMRGGEVFIPRIGASTLENLAHVVAPGCTFRIVGARPGEKWHEVLVTEDEARHTYDYGTHFRIEPRRTWEDPPLPVHDLLAGADLEAFRRRPPPPQRVPAGFVYGSDTADRIDESLLRRMVAA